MNEIAQFEIQCSYREEGLYCSNGVLYAFEPGNQMASLAKFDDEVVKCPRCKGLGKILTLAGEQIVEMVWRHLEPRVIETIEAMKEE